MAFTAAQRQDNLWDSPRASRGPGRGLGRWRAGASGHREAGHAHGLNTPAALRHAWPGVRAAPAPPLKPRGALLQGGPDHLTGSLSIRLRQLAAALPGGRHRPSRPLGRGMSSQPCPGGPASCPCPSPHPRCSWTPRGPRPPCPSLSFPGPPPSGAAAGQAGKSRSAASPLAWAQLRLQRWSPRAHSRNLPGPR